jgi:ParB/RepB/Spo0J family partition protein
MTCNPQTVSLSAIFEDEETYRITTAENTDGLAASIAHAGLINPPILIQRGSRFAIVCGFRRIAAARFLELRQLSARILDPETSHLDCIQLAIADNSFQRHLNPIEISRALSLLSPCFESESELCRTAGALGLPDSAPLIKKLIPLCKLPREVQDGVINGTISLQVALMFYSLETQAAIWFALFFKSSKISLNKQREIITLSQEIAYREDRSITSVLEDTPLRNIIDNPDLDRSRKASVLRSYLTHRRFPTLTRAKDAFEAILKSLKLENTAKLIYPADFEGTNYSLNLTFKDLTELERHKKTIDRIVQHPELKHLMDPAEYTSSS